jgi:hypothetical protein
MGLRRHAPHCAVIGVLGVLARIERRVLGRLERGATGGVKGHFERGRPCAPTARQ